MSSIALFYGSTTCYTEIVAEKIQAEFKVQYDIELPLFNIKDHALSDMLNFDLLILGISTWDFGEIQEDWESQWQDISSLDLNEKKIAIYGLGDQIGYADWYQDAMGMLFEECLAAGATPIAFTSTAGHEFNASKALTDCGNYFVGLALDEENQFELTERRIKEWISTIK